VIYGRTKGSKELDAKRLTVLEPMDDVVMAAHREQPPNYAASEKTFGEPKQGDPEPMRHNSARGIMPVMPRAA
jgi:hypothetical protein